MNMYQRMKMYERKLKAANEEIEALKIMAVLSFKDNRKGRVEIGDNGFISNCRFENFELEFTGKNARLQNSILVGGQMKVNMNNAIQNNIFRGVTTK